MKVRGTNAPANAFSIEQQPDKPGYVTVRFYENVIPYSEEVAGETTSGYEYDEYKLLLQDTDTLWDDILNDYDRYMEQARKQEIMQQSYDPGGFRDQVLQSEQARADIDFIAAMTGVDLV